jgi:hypothetical protein
VRFTALHTSFSEVEDGWVLALSETEDGTSGSHILLSFGDEGEQDRLLGLTGLFVADNWSGMRGYSLIEDLEFDGETIHVRGSNGYPDVQVEVANGTLSILEISLAVRRCKDANQSRPDEIR